MTMPTERIGARIAIALGDGGGVGPEVSLKAVAAVLAEDDSRYVLIGDEKLVRDSNQRLGLKLKLVSESRAGGNDRLVIRDPRKTPLRAGLKPGCREHARAALAWLKDGAALCLANEADALVTAPVNKEAIIRSGAAGFVGQTEFLSDLAKAKRTAMMLLGHDDRGRWLRVALATIHVPLARVAKALTRPKVELAIELAARACHDLGLARQRVAVCGLNPHAGEGGQIGTEEIRVIHPAVEAARRKGIDVKGSVPHSRMF